MDGLKGENPFNWGYFFCLTPIVFGDIYINKSLYLNLFIYERQPMKKIANIFKALSDDTRLRVVKLLQERELCVCELMQVLDMSQPRISRHMSVLKNAGLVEDRREGKWVHYSLRKETQGKEIKILLDAMVVMANDDAIIRADKKNLKKAIRLSEVKGSCMRCTF